MGVKIKLNKEKVDKIINECKYGIAVGFTKSNALEAKFVSIVLGVDRDEIKQIEKEDINELRERFGKGVK